MKQFTGTILRNQTLSAGFYELEFTWEKTAGSPLPGQFFTVRVSEDTVPLLRRPMAFSAFDKKKGTASMIFQKRGRGTALLAAQQKGHGLDIIGPLGNPFPVPAKDRTVLLVAGGIGLGPLIFLATRLREAGTPAAFVFGCRAKSLVPASGAFTGLNPAVCTDDGSAGFRGTAGDYLKSIESTINSPTAVYACGPLPLLKACHEFAGRRGCECFVSIEQVMACGVGACMGCAVRSARGGFLRACTEGPVFNSKELLWK